MIRYRRLVSLDTDNDLRRFSEVSSTFKAAFPHETEAVERIERCLRDGARVNFEPVLLLAEGRRGHVSLLAQESGYAAANLRAGAGAFFTGPSAAWY